MRDEADIGCDNGHQNYQHCAGEQCPQARRLLPEGERGQSHQGSKNSKVVIRAQHLEGRPASVDMMLL